VPSYFDRFGRVPVLSAHAWRRLRQRGIPATALMEALTSEPMVGATADTVVYTGEDVTAVVNSATGVIVTIWWTE